MKLFDLSGKTAFVSGEIIYVDGGVLAGSSWPPWQLS